MMTLLDDCGEWKIEEDVVTEQLWLTTRDCSVRLPASVIDAIRGMKPKQIPHLRRARKEVFSERSKRGWVTRRSDREDRLGMIALGVGDIVPENATADTCLVSG